jgi:hypothetical protein
MRKAGVPLKRRFLVWSEPEGCWLQFRVWPHATPTRDRFSWRTCRDEEQFPMELSRS